MTLKQTLPFSLALAAACAAYAQPPQSNPGQAAIALEQQGRLADAEKAWDALAKQYPTNAEPLAHMGLIEARQEHYPEAIAFYRKAMALNPALPGLRLNLGLALFQIRRLSARHRRAAAALQSRLH